MFCSCSEVGKVLLLKIPTVLFLPILSLTTLLTLFLCFFKGASDSLAEVSSRFVFLSVSVSVVEEMKGRGVGM